MRSGHVILVTMGALVGNAAQAEAQTVHPFSAPLDWQADARQYRSAVVRAYMSLLDEVRQAWTSGDVEAAVRLYANDATLLTEDALLVQGRDAIRTHFTGALPAILELRAGLTDFTTSDQLAYGIGPFQMRIRGADGEPRELTGTYMMLAVREGRSWKVRSQILRPAQAPPRN